MAKKPITLTQACHVAIDAMVAAGLPESRETLIERSGAPGRSSLSPEFGDVWACSVTVNVRMEYAGGLPRPDGKGEVPHFRVCTRIGTSGNSRSIAGTTVLMDLLQKAVLACSRIEEKLSDETIVSDGDLDKLIE